ncbi:MAG: hypothetical protein P4L86_14890 [Mycobacterium sp.]|nr:hypothetical protein [Mycobacterium sp.]
MNNSGPFGIDPEEFDRVLRETGEGIRGVLDRFGRGAGLAGLLNDLSRSPRPTQPETTGDTGDGVWVVYTVAADGGAHVEEVYPSELEALRANKNNTDPTRKVRFLPYGIGVSVLDSPEQTPPHDDQAPRHEQR